MKHIVKKRFPKKIIAVVSIVLLVSLASIVFVYGFNGNLFGWQSNKGSSSSTDDYKPATPEQQKSGVDIKKDSVNNQQDPSKPSTGSNDIPSNPQSQASGKSTVALDITSHSQTSSTYQIRTLIGATTNEGTCTLTLTKNTSNVTKTAPVSALAKTTTCQGFDIPMTELTAGTWQLNIIFSNSTLTGTATETIIIN